MKLEGLIDWVSATVKLSDVSLYPYWMDQMRGWAEKLSLIPRERFLPARGRFGYEMALRDKETGATVLFPQLKRYDMGIHLDMPGQACAEVCGLHLVQELVDMDASFSRIDATLDVHAGELNIAALRDELTRGIALTSAKSHQYIISNMGETLYVGSASSEKRLRIYDKAAERGVTADWKRIELQARGDTADALGNYLAAEGLKGIPAIIRAFCDFSNPVWQQAMGGVPGETLETDKRSPNRRRWLMGRVAKSVAIETLADEKFWAEFVEAVGAERGALSKDPVSGMIQPMLPW